ncbi:MAG: PAS domain S-box protein [Thermodesulfobacteriota bacterium]
MFPTYYLLNLAFTVGYAVALLVYLGRYSPDDPKTGAVERWLVWAVAWAFFDALVSLTADTHSPQAAFTLYRWLSFLPLMVPAFVGELILALMRPVRWRDRLWIYIPGLCFYLSALTEPGWTSARLYGVSLGASSHFNPWWQVFLLYSFSFALAMLVALFINTRREDDADIRHEKYMLVAGGLATLALQGLAQWYMAKAGPDFPALANLATSPIALAFYWGTKRYGKVISPRAMYRAMVQAVPSGLAHLQGGRLTWVNRSLAELLGYGRSEAIMGRRVEEVLRPAQASPREAREFLARLIRGRVHGEEVDLPDRNGQPVRCLVSSSMFARNEPGRGALMVASDLSRLRSMADDLQHSEARYRNLVEQSSEMIAVVQDEGVAYANKAVKDVLGWEPEEVLGKRPEAFFHPEDLQQALQRYRARITGRSGPQPFSCRMLTKDGEVKWMEAGARVVDWEGRPALQVFFRDISEHKQAQQEQLARLERGARQQAAIVQAAALNAIATGQLEAALAQLDELAAQALQVARASVWLLSPDREKLQCRDLFEAASGTHRRGPELAAASCPEYFAALEAGRTVEAADVASDPRISHFYQALPQARPAASRLDAAVRLEGRLMGAVCLEHDGPPRRWSEDEAAFAGAIADQVAHAMLAAQRRQAEEALKESERRYRNLFQSIGDFIYTHNLEGRLLSANPAVLKALGRPQEEVVGHLISEFMRPEDAESFRQQYLPLVRREGRAEGVTVYLDRDGGQHYLEYHNTLVSRPGREPYVSGSGREVTQRVQAQRELKQLQDHFVQVQKMEAVGVLASGIAHDFNNILQRVGGHVQLLAERPGLDEQSRGQLQQIDDAVNRAADLVRRLLEFGRKVDPRLAPLDLNQKVAEVVSILERTIPKMIAIESQLQPGLWRIRGDANQLEQLMMNLGANARDAMPQGGRLRLQTRNTVLGEEFCRLHPALKPGRYVVLTVSDTGQGMDEETLRHIFEPFYTTKKVGVGSGLGLFSAYGIVEAHRGYIACQSRPGQGATFTVYLPALSAEEAAAQPESLPAPQPRGGQETILVVDDELAILDSTRQLLAGRGYQVLTADSGERALEIYQERLGEVDLVILDLGMPGMGGERCLAGLLALNPRAKVIVATGYTQCGLNDHLLASGARRMMNKPYRLQDFLLVVRQVLDAP